MLGMARGARAAVAGVIAGLALAVTPAGAAEDEAEKTGEAQSSLTWSVQPAGEDGADGRAEWDLELEPGQAVEDAAQLNNFSDEEVTFRLYSHDAINSPDGGFTLQPADAEPVGVGAWVGLDEQITVEPGESTTVPFTLTVPQDATPGDHAGGIVASVTSETTDAQGQRVLVDNRVGSRIYLRVAGDVNPALEVSNLSVAFERSWIPFTTGAATVTYEVHNAGNVRLSGEQAVSGHGVFGLGDHTVTLDPVDEILPGESVTVSGQVDGVLPLFRVTEEVLVTPVAPQTSATVLPVVQAEASAQAWAVPWAELIILAVLVLLVLWSRWRRKHAKKKNAKQVDEAVAKAREEVRKELEAERVAAGSSASTTAGTGTDSGKGASSGTPPPDQPKQ